MTTPPPQVTTALDQPLSTLAGVGPAAQAKLAQLGLYGVRDLLWYFPNRYEDFSNRVSVVDIIEGQLVTVLVKVVDFKTRPARRRRLLITEATVADDTGSLRVIWFNQQYLIDSLKPGVLMALSGKAKRDKKGLALVSPVYEFIRSGEAADALAGVHTGRFVPVYPETEGVTSRWLRHKVQAALQYAPQIKDHLPPELIAKENLLALNIAVPYLHFPPDAKAAAAAKERITFDDALLLQLKIRQARAQLDKISAQALAFKETRTQEFVAKLPFKLTPSQRRAAWGILKDLAKGQPMNRLLEGDVGTGKTLVAAMAALQAADNQALTMILVPTEILALQHSQSFVKWLSLMNVAVAVLTSAYALVDEKPVTRLALLKKIKAGQIKVVVGTHALLESSLALPAPALVIVDEQHRFGVRQRSQLLAGEAASHAHFLSMTATPIPRTLAMTIYGTLDVSVLTDFPGGERRVTTRVVRPKERAAAYDFIRGHLKRGEQAFVICPLVEDSEIIVAKAATVEWQRLKTEVFKEFEVGLVHGQLSSAEKEAAMKSFSKNETQVLVATSVVEVGIDVPNASLMIIESAERFGLAQLHQLRGRIGRGSQLAYCFLFSESATQTARQRLSAFAKIKDGFELAETDLRMRGPGEFTGFRQSGLPDTAMMAMLDPRLVARAQEAADELLAQDPALGRYPLLKEAVLKRYEHVVLA